MAGREAYALVGLGNPGRTYQNTRHNVGFMFLDYLADRHGTSFQADRWDAETARCTIHDNRVFLVKPQTFMNLSGKAVAALMNYYRIDGERLLVVHDDIDMPMGRIKVVSGGGSGGHKGVQSIIDHLAGQHFVRLKIGVGRPGSGDTHPEMPVEAYVLAPFAPSEMTVMQERFSLIDNELDVLFSGNLGRAMTSLNRIRPIRQSDRE